MIEVQHLTKRYGQHVALDAVSFSVRHGEVVGFLGPNGAGKSTTMRILTTFMAATSGMARIGGDCVFENPMRVRKRLGYMPENNPLPPDLRVGDYLKFRAQLKRLANGKSARRIAEVMEQCGVADVAGRFHRAGLVDRYVVYVAPALLGGDDGLPLLAGPGAPTMAELRRGRFASVAALGDDLRLDLVLDGS